MGRRRATERAWDRDIKLATSRAKLAVQRTVRLQNGTIVGDVHVTTLWEEKKGQWRATASAIYDDGKKR